MDSLAITLLTNTVVMSLVILFLLLASRIFIKRHSAQWRYYSWLAAVIGLLIPIRPIFENAPVYIEITVPASDAASYAAPRPWEEIQEYYQNLYRLRGSPLMQAFNQADDWLPGQPDATSPLYADVVLPSKPLSVSVDRMRHPEITALAVVSAVPGKMLTAIVPSIPEKAAFRWPSVSWQALTGMVWLAGVLFYACFNLLKHRQFIHTTKRLAIEDADGLAAGLLAEVATAMQIKRKVSLKICPCLFTPMMTGFLKPLILLPDFDYSAHELRFIFRHELTHFKRGDLWYKLLILLASAVHWFNPLVYVMQRVIAVECEMSCDESVLRDADTENRKMYSFMILNAARQQYTLPTAFSTHFNSGMREIKNRIAAIFDTTRKRTGMGVLLTALLILLGTGFTLATARVAEMSAANESASETADDTAGTPDDTPFTVGESAEDDFSCETKAAVYEDNEAVATVSEETSSMLSAANGAADLTAVPRALMVEMAHTLINTKNPTQFPVTADEYYALYGDASSRYIPLDMRIYTMEADMNDPYYVQYVYTKSNKMKKEVFGQVYTGIACVTSDGELFGTLLGYKLSITAVNGKVLNKDAVQYLVEQWRMLVDEVLTAQSYETIASLAFREALQEKALERLGSFGSDNGIHYSVSIFRCKLVLGDAIGEKVS